MEYAYKKYFYTFRINQSTFTCGEREKERPNFYEMFSQSLPISAAFTAILKMKLSQCNAIRVRTPPGFKLRHLDICMTSRHRKVTQQDWYANHLCVINARERLVSNYSRFISSNVARFLHSFDHCVNSAKFYIIPKVH